MANEHTGLRPSARVLVRAAAASLTLLAAFLVAIGPGDAGLAQEKGKGKPSGAVNSTIEGSTLVVTGSAGADTIVLRLKPRDATKLLVEVPGDKKSNAEFSRDQFTSIRVDGGAGDDTLTVDETNGAFTDTEATTLNGESGNDKFRVVGATGSPLPIVLEGGDDLDTVEVNGNDGDETFATTANGTRVRFDRLSPAPFALDIGSAEDLVLYANGGNDSHSATGNLAALIKLTIDGGAGNDTILGSNGIDLLIGGDGNDFIDGQQGNDVVFMGAGDDIFQWDPGDGSDTVEGQAGLDTMLFNGSGVGEIFDVSPNGGRVRFLRNVGTIVMDLDDVERIDMKTLGGTDIVVVNPYGGTDLVDVNVDLAGTVGGSTGDALADTVIVNGTNANDTFQGSWSGGNPVITGPGTRVSVANGEPALDSFIAEGLAGNDKLTVSGATNGGTMTVGFNGGDNLDTVEVNGNDGDETFATTANGTRVRFDRISPAPFALDIGSAEDLVLYANGGNDSHSATGNLAALIKLTIDGGAGNDTILGSNGIDLLIGGDGNDFIDGQQGNDVVFMGAGDDVFQWDPGDGSDIVEGQAGFDTLLFNGSGANEIYDVSPNGGRVRFLRNVGNIVMDLDDVERIDLKALGGTDTVVVNDLTGTDVVAFNVDLATFGGVGDAQADTVIVNGTGGNDTILISGGASGVTVAGLAAQVNITAAEAANDLLAVNGLAGDDTIDASALAPNTIQLTLDGGPGNNVIVQ